MKLVPIKDSFKAHVHEAYITGIEQPANRRSLRSSSLPYCPILDVLFHRKQEVADLHGTYFTSVGTVFHSSIQMFMARAEDHGKYMWGDWKCVICRRQWSRVYNPIVCDTKGCVGIPIYDEIKLRVGNHTGTCDFLAIYPKRIKPKTVINDFKTCTVFPTSPKRQHLLQIRSYDSLLAFDCKLKVDYYYITYFLRSNLQKKIYGPYSTAKSHKQSVSWMFRSIAGFKAATQAHKDGDLKEVVKHRPCRCKADFDDYMSRKEMVFGDKDCPLLFVCCKSDKEVVKTLSNFDNLKGIRNGNFKIVPRDGDIS